MKNEVNNGITRRSFIKRSTVAAIAASNLMMFTGLVNAAEESSSPNGNCVPVFPNVGPKCHYYDAVTLKGWYCDCRIGNQQLILNGAKCDDKNGTNAKCI